MEEILPLSRAAARIPVRREVAVAWLQEQVDAGRIRVARLGRAPLVRWSEVVSALFSDGPSAPSPADPADPAPPAAPAQAAPAPRARLGMGGYREYSL